MYCFWCRDCDLLSNFPLRWARWFRESFGSRSSRSFWWDYLSTIRWSGLVLTPRFLGSRMRHAWNGICEGFVSELAHFILCHILFCRCLGKDRECLRLLLLQFLVQSLDPRCGLLSPWPLWCCSGELYLCGVTVIGVFRVPRCELFNAEILVDFGTGVERGRFFFFRVTLELMGFDWVFPPLSRPTALFCSSHLGW